MSLRVILSGHLAAVLLFGCGVDAHGRSPITLTLLSWAKPDGQWVFELTPTYGLSTMKRSQMSEFAAEAIAHHGVAADRLQDLKRRLALYGPRELRVYWVVVPGTAIHLPPKRIVREVTTFAESRHIPVEFKTAGKP